MVCVPCSAFVDVPLLAFTGAVVTWAEVDAVATVVVADLATEEYETPGTGVALTTASTFDLASL